jgi:hypothetical protein
MVRSHAPVRRIENSPDFADANKALMRFVCPQTLFNQIDSYKQIPVPTGL